MAVIPIAAGVAIGAIVGGITGGRKGAMIGAAGGAIGGALAPAAGGLAGAAGGGAAGAGGYGVAEGAGWMLGDVAGTAAAGSGAGAVAGGAGGALSGIGSALSTAAPYISTAGSLASAFMGQPGGGAIDYGNYTYQPPEIKTMAPDLTGMEIKYATTGERTPAEIDAANRLRIEREKSYAAQKAQAESDLLKALSTRDISSGTNPETALMEQRTAAQKFVGLPPTLGQARHSWA